MPIVQANESLKVEKEIEEIESEEEMEDHSALHAAQQSRDALSSIDQDDLFSTFDPDEEDDIEADEFNDPRVSHLEEAPVLGGRGRTTDLFGRSAHTPIGRATSPRIYASAAQHATCTQLRLWKIENGVPVGLGVIDATSTEEDMVMQFRSAMPKKGEGRCRFKARPIDINGQEMGTEVSFIISEHHGALQRLRRMDEEGAEDTDDVGTPYHHYPPQNDSYDRIMRTADRRVDLLQAQLDDERESIRRREEGRMQDQVDMATNAAQGIQVLTNRMMEDESQRAERAMRQQQEQSQTLMTTLTTIFAQQQSMMQQSSEQTRRADEFRLEQERQRASRERNEMEERRQRERLELEERRLRDREEHDRKMQMEREQVERKLLREQKDLEMRMQRDREEQRNRSERERSDREAREQWIREERLRKEGSDLATSKERELERQRRHERLMAELLAQQTRDREHAERMMVLSKQELSNKAMGGIQELIPKAAGFLQTMGIDPTSVVQKIFAPEAAPAQGGWAEAIPALLGAAGEVAKAAIHAKSGVPPVMGTPSPLPQVEDRGYDEEELYAQHQQRRREAEQPIITPPPSPDGAINIKNTGYARPPQPDPLQQAQQAGLGLGEQRNARFALRNLVRSLAAAPQPEWEGKIGAAITHEVSIFHYIQAVGCLQALEETGADGALTQAIIVALKASPIVPNDLNYGV